MRVRVALAAAAFVAGSGTAAVAAPRTYCNLVVGNGHGTMQNQAYGTVVPGGTADTTIRSADIASDARYLTAVIRLRGESGDPTRPVQGRRYQFGFGVPHSEYGRWWIEMITGRETSVFLYRVTYTETAPGYYDGEREIAAVGTGRVDSARAEVRMTVPLKGVTNLPRGARLRELGASIDVLWAEAAGNPADFPSDWRGVDFRDAANADPRTAYPLGARSCVRPGPA